MTDETVPQAPDERAAHTHEWARDIRKGRLLDALFFVYTFREVQPQGLFGHPDWLQNLESSVMVNLFPPYDERYPHVTETPREANCFNVVGLLGITLYRDRLARHKLLQGFFAQQPATETAVMASIADAYSGPADANGTNHEVRLAARKLPTGIQHPHELPAAALELPVLEKALNPFVDSLQQQLLGEGYDATNWADFLRAKNS